MQVDYFERKNHELSTAEKTEELVNLSDDKTKSAKSCRKTWMNPTLPTYFLYTYFARTVVILFIEFDRKSHNLGRNEILSEQ